MDKDPTERSVGSSTTSLYKERIRPLIADFSGLTAILLFLGVTIGGIIAYINAAPWWLCTAIALFLVNLFAYLVGWNLGRRNSAGFPAKVSLAGTSSVRHRIAILLPLTNDDPYVKQDVQLTLEGFGNALPKLGRMLPTHDLQFYDHQNSPTVAHDLVARLLQEGYQYIIATMSPVCVPLSKSFPLLVKEKSPVGAILICTVAASPKVETAPNSTYRFFVNADQEAAALVQYLKHDRRTAAVIRFTDSTYGEEIGRAHV